MAVLGCFSGTCRLTVGGSASLLRSFGDILPPPDGGVRSASGGIGGRFLSLGGITFFAGEDDRSESDV